jgi:hypothetical protein
MGEKRVGASIETVEAMRNADEGAYGGRPPLPTRFGAIKRNGASIVDFRVMTGEISVHEGIMRRYPVVREPQ